MGNDTEKAAASAVPQYHVSVDTDGVIDARIASTTGERTCRVTFREPRRLFDDALVDAAIVEIYITGDVTFGELVSCLFRALAEK